MPDSPKLDATPLSHTSIVPASSADEGSLLLPHDPDLHSLDFDQLQRYSIVARLLDRLLAGSSSSLRVLEVGTNVLNLLPRFLNPSRVQIIRCDVERFSDDPEFVVIEKDKPLPFADESFDAVASLEVLEHIAPEGRRFFIEECLRVARRGLVLTCPNGVDEVVAAERLAAEAYQFRHGRPHPCLIEHDQCGLPRPQEVL